MTDPDPPDRSNPAVSAGQGATFPSDDGIAIDWRRLIPDYDILCFVALNVAVAAGRRGALTPEAAARWWIDLYRADRQEPWLSRAERTLLRWERSDRGIAIEVPTGDDTAERVRLIGPTHGGVAAVVNLDRMIRRLFARANLHTPQGTGIDPANPPKPSDPLKPPTPKQIDDFLLAEAKAGKIPPSVAWNVLETAAIAHFKSARNLSIRTLRTHLEGLKLYTPKEQRQGD